MSASTPSIVPDRAPVHVAVGVLTDDRGRVLVARRRDDVPFPGWWEFPGGKLDPGESVTEALVRELDEELGVRVEGSEALIRVGYRYPHLHVLLDVHRVTRYRGVPRGREGQRLAWIDPESPGEIRLLPANRPIRNALRLPECYVITDTARFGVAATLQRLETALAAGLRLVQVREKAMAADAYARFVVEVIRRAREHGARVLLNAEPEVAVAHGADGVHLGAAALERLARRPLPDEYLIGASCHDAAELARAAELDCDFAVLGPVCTTASHPGAHPIGWERFAGLVDEAPLPVYALGGLRGDDLAVARRHGGQGVAMISALWCPD